jgi:hypothetical protein
MSFLKKSTRRKLIHLCTAKDTVEGNSKVSLKLHEKCERRGGNIFIHVSFHFFIELYRCPGLKLRECFMHRQFKPVTPGCNRAIKVMPAQLLLPACKNGPVHRPIFGPTCSAIFVVCVSHIFVIKLNFPIHARDCVYQNDMFFKAQMRSHVYKSHVFTFISTNHSLRLRSRLLSSKSTN